MNYKDLIERLRHDAENFTTGSAAEAANVIEHLTAQLAGGPAVHIVGPDGKLQPAYFIPIPEVKE